MAKLEKKYGTVYWGTGPAGEPPQWQTDRPFEKKGRPMPFWLATEGPIESVRTERNGTMFVRMRGPGSRFVWLRLSHDGTMAVMGDGDDDDNIVVSIFKAAGVSFNSHREGLPVTSYAVHVLDANGPGRYEAYEYSGAYDALEPLVDAGLIALGPVSEEAYASLAEQANKWLARALS